MPVFLTRPSFFYTAHSHKKLSVFFPIMVTLSAPARSHTDSNSFSNRKKKNIKKHVCQAARAPVECGHRFISWACLHLPEVCSRISAFWTSKFRIQVRLRGYRTRETMKTVRVSRNGRIHTGLKGSYVAKSKKATHRRAGWPAMCLALVHILPSLPVALCRQHVPARVCLWRSFANICKHHANEHC